MSTPKWIREAIRDQGEKYLAAWCEVEGRDISHLFMELGGTNERTKRTELIGKITKKIDNIAEATMYFLDEADKEGRYV